MKKIIIIAVALLVSSPALFAQLKAGKQDNAKHTVLNICTTHSRIIINEPGKCPLCGMNVRLSQKEQLKSLISKTYTCPVNADIARGKPLNRSLKEQMKWEVVKLNNNTARANVSNNNSEKCPKCGVEVVQQKTKSKNG
jgi:predicted RNA-binding Zn-ribbon protein involved in translation (DUF1610 family)